MYIQPDGDYHTLSVCMFSALHDNGVAVSDISYVIGTHGHSDHIGNLNLFPHATFIVCYDVCKGHEYLDNNLSKGEAYVLSEGLSVIPTPGHTGSDVSLVVENSQLGTVVVAGEDIGTEHLVTTSLL